MSLEKKGDVPLTVFIIIITVILYMSLTIGVDNFCFNLYQITTVMKIFIISLLIIILLSTFFTNLPQQPTSNNLLIFDIDSREAEYPLGCHHAMPRWPKLITFDHFRGSMAAQCQLHQPKLPTSPAFHSPKWYWDSRLTTRTLP